MKFTGKKLLFLLLYALLVGAVYLASATLTKYSSGEHVDGTFNIGGNLYFKYKRGDLLRNDVKIEGVEFVEGDKRRIETMNVAPGDSLNFSFFVSNYNDLSPFEENTLDGSFYVSAYAEFTMPAHKTNYRLTCSLEYRKVKTDGNPDPFISYTSDHTLDLPRYDEEVMNWEFRVSIILDDQIATTSADDYFGSTLSILLFVDAANDVITA